MKAETKTQHALEGMARRIGLISLAVAMLAAMAGGCAGRGASGSMPTTRPGSPQQTVAPITNTDPCAMRLHDLCGALLLYFATNRQLPARLEQLQQVPGFEQVTGELRCPVSGLPYVYNPAGWLLPEKQQRVIIYDRTPAHDGMRWAITIEEPKEDQPLITKVIALPESRFTFQPR
ncbi:hypothetical protein [Fontivita pretiosa]|jgi:hypothetical protein|uniref:hypothetical protein n=1 Tax=Fontivita pretiosa TaxID=2989684 RepID=UPI003D16946E